MGTCHAKKGTMKGTIKDTSGKDLIEAEEIKKWQECRRIVQEKS